MRSSVIYGSLILFCVVISTANADKKWQYGDEKSPEGKTKNRGGNGDEKHKNGKNSKKYSSTEMDIASANDAKHRKTETQFKKPKGKILNDDDNSSEELASSKHTKQNGNEAKKFIGRIERGKVMVLRRKDENEEVCRKSTSGKRGNCNGNGNDPDSSDEDHDDSNEENGKPKKKIKYSIKFQHEKQKQKKSDGDMRIMKLHRNGKKRYGKDDDDDDSDEEDDSPIKRFHFIDDDD